MQRVFLALLSVGLALAAAGCAGGDDAERAAAAKPQPATCPQQWRSGWQRLANRVDAPVYCPSWMPSPLDGAINGQWNSSGPSVSLQRSFLVSFLWHEAVGGDVHVNFRGYPGQTTIPRCIDTQTVAGVTRRRPVPCFSDPQGPRRVGGLDVTVYTVSRDADQWHVTYAWRRNGTLYTVSEHVAPPLTFRRVLRNLDRIVRGLVVIRPNA